MEPECEGAGPCVLVPGWRVGVYDGPLVFAKVQGRLDGERLGERIRCHLRCAEDLARGVVDEGDAYVAAKPAHGSVFYGPTNTRSRHGLRAQRSFEAR